MATGEYLHVCDSAFMAEGGKHCIIGIFDSIRAATFPATHPTMTVAFRVQGQPFEAVNLRLELARPNGDVLATLTANLTLSDEGNHVLNVNMANTQFPEPGRYLVKVYEGRNTLVSHSLPVLQLQVAAPQGPAAPEILH
jgi:hypothetical protein